MPEIALHEAFAGQPFCAGFAPGVQMRAQREGVEEPWVSSTHWGSAVVPVGTSLGQAVVREQAGEQNEPARPVTSMDSSPERQGPALGSP